MGLFSELFPLCREVHLTLLVSANTASGTMTISIMPRAKAGVAGNPLKDLTMTSTPEEFDADFLPAFTGYRDTLLPVMAQAEAAKTALKKNADSKAETKEKPLAKTTAAPAADSSKPPAASKLTDAPKEANDDPDTDWMKNRQPELF